MLPHRGALRDWPQALTSVCQKQLKHQKHKQMHMKSRCLSAHSYTSGRTSVARQLLCTGCGLGEGQVALVHAKRSRAPLSTEKHICFGTISFRSSSGPPLAQMPPRCLPNVSQMPPRCLSDGSQMPLRCLSDASRCFPDASRCFPKKTVWGLALG